MYCICRICDFLGLMTSVVGRLLTSSYDWMSCKYEHVDRFFVNTALKVCKILITFTLNNHQFNIVGLPVVL